jgi:polar amino acid transport system substrate-binding protein
MSRLSRMTKIIAAFAALSLTAGVSACGDDNGSSGNSSAPFNVVKAGKFTVCTDAPYAPFEYEEDGKWTGFDLDILRAFAEEYDLDLEVSVQSFEGIWLKPAAGDCDIVASAMTILPERAENALFSDPYYNAAQSIMVRSDDKDVYVDLASLSGKAIGVQSGTTGADYAKANAKGAQIQEFDEASPLFLALESGQIDAILQDLPVNVERVKEMGKTTITAVFETDEFYGFAAALGNTALITAVNATLAAMQDDGRYDALYEKYFS